jgi:hypothetical protein
MGYQKAAAAAGALATVMAAACAAATSGRAASFSGSCDFNGVEALIDRPVGIENIDLSIDISGPGECTGLLDGASLVNATTNVQMRVAGHAGCLNSAGDLVGPGTFDFGSASILVAASVRVDFPGFFHFSFTGGTGTASGDGLPIGSVPLGSSPLQYDIGCFTGGVCDVIDQPCQTQRRGALEFAMKTTGIVTPVSSPGATSTAAPPTDSPARPTPALASLLRLPSARRCTHSRRLEVRAWPRWRSAVSSFQVIARGHTKSGSGRSIITVRGPISSLLVTFAVVLKDGRSQVGQRRYVACR